MKKTEEKLLIYTEREEFVYVHVYVCACECVLALPIRGPLSNDTQAQQAHPRYWFLNTILD